MLQDQTDRVSPGLGKIKIRKFSANEYLEINDFLAKEEPLEIRLEIPNQAIRKTVSITMRTPGEDFDLALGFLFTEGILKSDTKLYSIRHCEPKINGQEKNIVRVELQSGETIDLKRLERNFYTNSSCGVCGKSSIEALSLENQFCLQKDQGPTVSVATISKMQQQLRKQQILFAQSGSIHASAIFNLAGEIECCREDVGRHNALDKIIGHYFSKQQLPMHSKILLLSGRISFELVQKAAMAGIAIIVAVGAPSTLAVELARQFKITLVGFVRENSMNIYSGEWRIQCEHNVKKSMH